MKRRTKSDQQNRKKRPIQNPTNTFLQPENGFAFGSQASSCFNQFNQFRQLIPPVKALMFSGLLVQRLSKVLLSRQIAA